jgi:hypothetical protein
MSDINHNTNICHILKLLYYVIVFHVILESRHCNNLNAEIIVVLHLMVEIKDLKL